MKDNRQELVETLIEKLIRALHDMHKGQGFPFGNMMLKRPQIMTLFFINSKKGEASVKEIAKFLQVTPGAVTQFVDGLIEKKLVQREESVLDRRSVNIKLTSGTKKKFNDFKKKYLTSASKTFNDFSDSDLKKLTELLNKIKN